MLWTFRFRRSCNGFLVRTKPGKWLHLFLESRLLMRAAGYSLIQETVQQFLGAKKSPFSSVALVRIFGNETLVSAFITDEHADGSFPVFVPTGMPGSRPATLIMNSSPATLCCWNARLGREGAPCRPNLRLLPHEAAGAKPK